jgi:methyl-accepting chemotaxis protein
MNMDELVSSIANATHDQSQQLTQINVAISDLDSGTQENAAMAQEYNHVAAGLLSNAQRLTSLVSNLTVDQVPERDHAKAYAASRGAA